MVTRLQRVMLIAKNHPGKFLTPNQVDDLNRIGFKKVIPSSQWNYAACDAEDCPLPHAESWEKANYEAKYQVWIKDVTLEGKAINRCVATLCAFCCEPMRQWRD